MKWDLIFPQWVLKSRPIAFDAHLIFMPDKENVIGKKYNLLTVISDAPYLTKYTRRVNCLCDCGNYTIVQLSNLKTGHTKSCGCHNKAMLPLNNLTHGMSKSGEYKSYHKMLERCYNQKDISYPNYGKRGVIVCDRWRQSFENFLYDMGVKPSKFHSIERDDTNGNYEPSNCRWATKKEQNNNRTNNSRLSYNGETKTLTQWSESLNVHYSRIIFHMNRGVSFVDIVEYINKNGSQRLQFRPPSRKWWPRKLKQ